MIILGMCLWFFPGTLANKIVREDASDAQAVEYREIHLIAITTLGLYLLANGASDLIYHAFTVFQLKREYADYPFRQLYLAVCLRL